MRALRMLRNSEKGFTLIEIMIVVLIIGILLAVAIPNFMKARETSRQKSCVANLKQIDAGKEQYAMDKSIPEAGACAWADIQPYVKGPAPTCPSDSTAAYTVNVIGTNPTCGYAKAAAEGHVLP